MRKVLFKAWIQPQYTTGKDRHLVPGTGCWSDFTNEGLFHQWAVDYEEFDNSYPQFTFALVELRDGSIVQVLPKNLRFVYANDLPVVGAKR